jgi:hypothetical protein
MSPYSIGARPRPCSSLSSRARRSTQCCCADTGPIRGGRVSRRSSPRVGPGSAVQHYVLHCVRDDSAFLGATTDAQSGPVNAKAGTSLSSSSIQNGLKLRKSEKPLWRPAHRPGAGRRGAIDWAPALSALVSRPEMLIVRPLETGSGRRARDPSGTLETDV